jgi:hypothetical protein
MSFIEAGSQFSRRQMIRRPHKGILLNLDPTLVTRIDEAVRLLYGNRTRFLTEAALRNLRFFENTERPTILRLRKPAP